MEILILIVDDKCPVDSTFKFQYGDTHTGTTVTTTLNYTSFKFQYGDTHTLYNSVLALAVPHLNSNMEILIQKTK